MKNLFFLLFSFLFFAASAQEVATEEIKETKPTLEDTADAKAAQMIEKFGFPNSIRTQLAAIKLERMKGIAKAENAKGQLNRQEVVKVNRAYKIALSKLLTNQQFAMVQKDWDAKWEKMKDSKAVKEMNFDELKDE